MLETEGKCDVPQIAKDIRDHAAAMEALAPQRRWQRAMKWLGFGAPAHPAIPDEIDQHPGLAAGSFDSVIITKLDLRDRLRVLASGTLMQITRHKTDRHIGEAYSFSAFSVLPPFVNPVEYLPPPSSMVRGNSRDTIGELHKATRG